MNPRKQILLGMLEDTPGDCFLKYALALELRKEGDQEAISQLKALTAEFPDYVPAWHQLASWLAEDGNREEAMVAAKTGIALALKQEDRKAAGEMSELLLLLEYD